MPDDVKILAAPREGRPTALLVGAFEDEFYQFLREAGLGVLLVPDPQAAVRTAGSHGEEVVLSSLYMGEGAYTGMEVLDAYRSKAPAIPVVISTHERRPAVVVEAMRRGAFDYVNEPFSSYQHVLKIVMRAREAFAAASRSVRLHRAIEEASVGPFVTRMPELRRVLSEITRLAQSRATVLLEGESGTGKGLVASMIHEASPRSHGPFVVFNCAAVPETLIESELFGHRRGAFTGAEADRDGIVKSASGGTLLLDEISSLPLHLQGSLLRVMEEGSFRPVGGDAEETADVRFITASNRDLLPLVEKGEFREDLYYRVNALPVTLPPLRERQADIPMLAQCFLEEALRQTGKQIRGISGEAMAALLAYGWPGNVRELRNVVERGAVVDRDGVLDHDDLPAHLVPVDAAGERTADVVPPSALTAPIDLKSVLEDVEMRLVREALSLHPGNVTAAARHLGLARTTLLSRMRKLDIGETTGRGS